jgi:hypothetical protein
MQRQKKKGVMTWLHKRVQKLLQLGSAQQKEQQKTGTGQQTLPIRSAAAAAAVQADSNPVSRETFEPTLNQQQQQQEQQRQSCHYLEAPMLSELRLLPPLRHTLSTVLSSNLSTAMSSIGSSSMAMQAVYESEPGCRHNMSSGSNILLSIPGADVATGIAAAPCGANSSSSYPVRGSSSSPGGGSISQQTTTRWSYMLQAAGLGAASSSSTGGVSSSNSSSASVGLAAAPQPLTQHSSSCSDATASVAEIAANAQANPQQQQQQQQQLAAHELQHMHMLAERYAQQQQQLYNEPSSLSTVTERSETRTTPRGFSFTSNFTHDFTVMSGRPSCEFHCEVAGRPDSCSSQSSSACALSSYLFSPRQQQQRVQEQPQQQPLQQSAPGASCSAAAVLPHMPSAAVEQQQARPARAGAPAGSVEAAAVVAMTASRSRSTAAFVSSVPTVADIAAAAAAVRNNDEHPMQLQAAESPAAVGVVQMCAASQQQQQRQQQQHGVPQEQQATQAAVQWLRAQLCTAADRAAAVPSPWGSCDSDMEP